jgi:hypothetical protein
MREGRVHTEDTEDHGEPLSPGGSHDEAPQAVFQAEHIEVHQQPYFPSAQAQLGQKLRLMDLPNGFNGLDLQDQFVGDDDVSPKAAIHQFAPINNRKRDLTLEGDANFGEFKAKALLINRFQKPRPKMLVQIDRQSDHLLGQFATHQHHIPQWSSVVLGVLRVKP